MSLVFLITNAGRAALVNAANNGTNAVQIVSCGLSATAVVPSAAAVALAGEFKRVATISGTAVAADVIHAVVRDESGDAYTARSLALYLADGTLFGIYGQADPIINKAAGAVGLLAIDLTLVDVSATAITFGNTNFLNPPATTTTAGVVELADDTEAAALVDALRALTPRGLAQVFTGAKILARLLTVDGAGSGLDADLLDGQEGAYYTNIIARLGFTPLNAAAYTAADVLAKLVAVDGAGSGVDADLLDGQQGTWYADIASRLGFTPLNAATYTAANVLAKLLTVDGAGSGLDADLLDGQDSSFYTAIAARLGFNPVQQATGVGQLGNAVKIGWTGARVAVTIDATNMGNVVFDGNINDVWRASNDGAGSGLDSDLLDGQQGAWYADVAARLGFTPANAAARGAANGLASLDAGGNVPAAQLNLAVPVGTISLFYGYAAPSGWAICDGQVVARSDGSGAIQTPDLRGRVAVGYDGSHPLGDAFGQATATVNTSTDLTDAYVSAPLRGSVAGGGSGTAVNSAALVDYGHDHQVIVDVTQPSLALTYIMKV